MADLFLLLRIETVFSSAVLDEIFQNENDIKILKEAYDALIKDGFSEDGAAEKISKLIFEDTGIEPDYGFEEEE